MSNAEQQLKNLCLSQELTEFQDSFSEQIWGTTYKDHQDFSVDDSMFRVARHIASVEKTEELRNYWTQQFYALLTNFKATAGGRIYANAGAEWKGTTLINCYVGPRVREDLDSLNSILEHLRMQALTLKSEGGWGENFSYIRPRGAFIYGIGVETPGAVRYMELFDKSSEIITSGSGKKSTNTKAKGKIRKGAMMAVLDIWHPDILEFITAKQSSGRLTKFNMSVNCTDEFMQRLVRIQELDHEVSTVGASYSHISEEDFDYDGVAQLRSKLDKWELIFPDTQHPNYKSDWTGDIKVWKEKGFPVIVYNTVSVMQLWNTIMDSTYNRAEPGVLFLDRANHFLPLYYAETVFATNPCGEQLLAPGGACNLGSLNLTQFVNKDFTDFDYGKVVKYVKILVRFLDNVNDATQAPLPEYEWAIQNKRRIGVGIMGWASSLYMLKTRFAGERASAIRDKLMETIAKTAYMASIDLAVEKGMFSVCDPVKHAAGVFVNKLGLSEEYMTKLRTTGIRNSSLLSIQPTGNTSIFANVSSGGLEPVFSHEYIRTVIMPHLPENMKEFTPKWFEGEWHETEVFKFTKEGDEEILRGVVNNIVYKIDKNRGLTQEVLCEDYGVRAMKKRGEWDPTAEWASSAMDMQVEDHVSDLTGFATWIDSAISKTVNCPNDYPLESFKNIYLDCYKSGVVKGVTTYRSGTMTTVLAAKDEKNATDSDEEIILQDVKLPATQEATMQTLTSESRKWYVTITWNEDRTRPFALFVHTNSSEKNTTTTSAVDHLLALAKRKGIPDTHINETLCKITNDNNTTKIARMISLNLRHGVLLKNIVAALDQVEEITVSSFLFRIKKWLATFIQDGEKVEGEKCSECGGDIVFSEGCQKCVNCGSSRCS
jgi:ribonucleoside-diphosphate reductase alpha chain